MAKNFLILPILLIAALLSACEQEGSAERAGAKLDDAAEALREKSTELGNKVEDACEQLKAKAGAEDTDC
ncbi:hypothetical protein NO559_12305 [Dasania sp. GY-MA-18]|uniref:Uncharacterized protein n=1 Tax=Dasania phycosphaerae TaxID=2950436 RepID=A0A9J6RP81_9GAMM|nr:MULTISPECIES: hypothetical protein [Dasania]MCR8923558.1 hypothetical protein [Dasania sp. GY-MA-18]MCZ0865992.1 hypothetical protein [Dasania phycosphaerae]MCZ0869716.1 hypothetical protein [Dasania phycosphaerae]